jgi:hypothetical protein
MATCSFSAVETAVREDGAGDRVLEVRDGRGYQNVTFRAQRDYFQFAGDADISTRLADSVASVSLLLGPVLDTDCLPLFSLRPICTSILGTRTNSSKGH